VSCKNVRFFTSSYLKTAKLLRKIKAINSFGKITLYVLMYDEVDIFGERIMNATVDPDRK